MRLGEGGEGEKSGNCNSLNNKKKTKKKQQNKQKRVGSVVGKMENVWVKIKKTARKCFNSRIWRWSSGVLR